MKQVNYKHLQKAAVIYISLPLLVFCIGFLRWYFALMGVIAIVYAIYSALKTDNVEQEFSSTITLDSKTIICVFGFALIWTYFGGMNGYWFQSSDWSCRNPIYFDLIKYDWPVVYLESGGALSYYIGHWLPPAVVGKVFFALTNSFRWGRFIGKMALWGWSSLGLTIIILLLFCYLKLSDKKKRVFAVIIFMCFSGLDVIGAIYNDCLRYLLEPAQLHLEWWNSQYQFSSITTCVYWVFNQTIIPWMITLCFMFEKNSRNYVLYGASCLLCGPFPFVGIAICMIIKAVVGIVKECKKGPRVSLLSNIFSLSNIMICMFVVPIVATYILSNNALSGGTTQSTVSVAEATSSSFGGGFFSSEYFNMNLIIFLLLEVGVYIILIAVDNIKNPTFYSIILIFIIAPYFKIGTSNDFCMRVSVPAVFILMVYVNAFIQRYFTLRFKFNSRMVVKNICALILSVCVMFGSVTAGVEIYRGFYHVIDEQTIRLDDRSIETFNTKDVPYNFGCNEPGNQLFFKIFAKKEIK